MEIRTTQTDRAPKAVGPYSQAIVAGHLIFTAGQLALDPASGELVPGDITAQTERVIANLAAVLESAGSDLAHVVKTTVFLTDLGDFAAMNDAYARAFGSHRPARSTVEVSKLARGAKIEIECVAARA